MKRIFTPGPVAMYENILDIGKQQVPYFRNDEFSNIVLQCEEILLDFLSAPKGSRCVFLTCSGTGAMEATVINLLNKKQPSIVVNGGAFGQRFVDICNVHEVPVLETDSELKNLDSFLEYKPSSLLINAHETSIGKLYDINITGSFCKKNKLLHIVDAISCFVTDKIDMHESNIDALIISSHKGLALPPGLSVVVLSPKAIDSINVCKSFYFDFSSHLKDGLRGQTPFTPAISVFYQMHQALLDINTKGICFYNDKAAENARFFRKGIVGLPLGLFSKDMPNAMTALEVLDSRFSAKTIVERLEKDFGCVVAPNGGELSNKVFRVSHMGNLSLDDTFFLIEALKKIFKE